MIGSYTKFPKERHNSIRGEFAAELYEWMSRDESIVLVVGDLGYGIFDCHFRDFPDRCFNVGAAEVAMMGIAVGLVLEGKKPFVYSITSFLINRPYETIRLYINHENIPVRLIGSGRDKDYHIDGWSHDCSDIKPIMDTFTNIEQYWPDLKAEIPMMVYKMVKNNVPTFISLKR